MNNFVSMLSTYKPSILNGIGLGAGCAAIWTAWELSPMAKDAIEEKKRELETDDLPFIETARTIYPYVIPVILLAGSSAGLIMASSHETFQRQAAAMAAYTVSEATSQLYREKVKEIVGERKEKDIHEATAKETYYKDLNENKMVIVSGGSDSFWIYDGLTKQKIRSRIEKVHSTINELNRRMLSHDITLDDYCLAMNEEPMEFGTELGWKIDRGYIELEPPTAIVSENGEPVIVITHRILPRNLY